MNTQKARESQRFWEQILEQLDIKINLAILDCNVSMDEYDTLLENKRYCYRMIADCIRHE